MDNSTPTTIPQTGRGHTYINLLSNITAIKAGCLLNCCQVIGDVIVQRQPISDDDATGDVEEDSVCQCQELGHHPPAVDAAAAGELRRPGR